MLGNAESHQPLARVLSPASERVQKWRLLMEYGANKTARGQGAPREHPDGPGGAEKSAAKFTERSRNVDENKELLFLEWDRSRNVDENKDVSTRKPECF